MTLEQLEAIRKAIEILQMTPDVKRIDGSNWSVYMVGKMIRVDIKDE